MFIEKILKLNIIKFNVKIYFLFHIIFYLIRNKKIFQNKNIFLAYHWAFGHQVIMLESFIRMFDERNIEKTSLIEIVSLKHTNNYLSSIYLNYYDIFKIFQSNQIELCNAYFSILNTIFKIIKIFNKKIRIFTYKEIINVQENKIKLKEKILHYNELKNKICERNENYYWIDKLPKFKIKYTFSNELTNICQKVLIKNNCDIKKKTVINFFFREKKSINKKINTNLLNYFDVVRNQYNAKNYFKSIEYLAKKNKNNVIFIHGIKRENFKNIILKNIFFVEDFKNVIDFRLLNLFLHYNSYLNIMQNSGVLLLPHFMKKKIIVADMFPFCFGIPGHHKVLFSRLRINNVTYKIHQITNTKYFYGEGINMKNVKIIPNSSKEILTVIKDSNNRNSKKIKFPSNSLISYRENIIYY
jgi:hypothetical protein